MTENKEIELCKKACKIEKEKRNTNCRLAIINLISTILVGLCLESLCTQNEVSMKAPVVVGSFACLGILFLVLVVAIPLSCIAYKSFVSLIHEGEYEVIKRNYDDEDWYYIHIPDTKEYVRVERIVEKEGLDWEKQNQEMAGKSIWEPQCVFYAGKTIYWEPFYLKIAINYLRALSREMSFREAFNNIDAILDTPYEEADEHMKKVLMTKSPKDFVKTALSVIRIEMCLDGKKAELTVGDVLDWLETSKI